MTQSPSNWTVPNVLTVARILMTPLFVVCFLSHEYWAALGIFLLCGATDALDGLLARVLNQRTRLGAMLDPLADKVLLDTSFVCLAEVSWLPAWLAVMVVSRDVIILGGTALLAFCGRDMRAHISPSMVSKLTTAFQMFMVLAAFAVNMVDVGAAGRMGTAGLALATGALTVLSGSHYIMLGFSMFPAGQASTDDRPGPKNTP